MSAPHALARRARQAFVLPIRLYRYTLSALLGRHCRHWPSCSEYTEKAVLTHGIWPGGWMGFARICRCRPGGTSGIDLVCEALPPHGRWYLPWRYGLWASVNAPPAPAHSLLDALEEARAAAPRPSVRG